MQYALQGGIKMRLVALKLYGGKVDYARYFPSEIEIISSSVKP